MTEATSSGEYEDVVEQPFRNDPQSAPSILVGGMGGQGGGEEGPEVYEVNTEGAQAAPGLMEGRGPLGPNGVGSFGRPQPNRNQNEFNICIPLSM